MIPIRAIALSALAVAAVATSGCSGGRDLAYKSVKAEELEKPVAELAARLREELIGMNVLAGRWSFQVVEDFDDTYWTTARELERAVREEVTGGRRHVYEAELKQRRRTHGRPGHEATPQDL